MKTVSELTAERETLQAALVETQSLANERTARSHHLQVVTAATILGTKTRGDLEQTQARLEESVEALTRVEFLRQAVADLDQQITVARGAERRKSCEAIANEHAALYANYKEASKALLAQFRQLQTLNGSHMGLTGRELHGAHERELNLPAVTGSLCSRSNFTTGQE